MQFSLIRIILVLTVVPFAVTSTAQSLRFDAAGQDGVVEQNLPFIGLRDITGVENAEDYFGDERAAPSFGVCVLRRRPVPFTSTKSFQSLARNGYLYIPDEIIDIEAIRTSPDEKFWPGLKTAVGNTRPILYIHGYNMSFARSCKQASLFEQNMGAERQVLLFSWPSDGALLNYTRDEADLQWSVGALADALKQMQAHFGNGGFDVVAHSLGSRGLVYALNQLARESNQDVPVLNQLVLVAADIDAGIFKQVLPSIRPLVAGVSVYVSANDKPLALSSEVHGYPRLGETGAHLRGMDEVEIIDLSDLSARSFSGHLYHLYHDAVIADLRQLLVDQQAAADRSGLNRQADNYWRLTSADQ